MAETKAQRVRRAVEFYMKWAYSPPFDAVSHADWLKSAFDASDAAGREVGIKHWVALSTDSRGHWDALRHVACEFLRDDPGGLHPELREWIARVLEAKLPRPDRRGRDKVGLHRNVFDVVEQASLRWNLPRTRSIKFGLDCNDDGGSSCDVAGQVFGIESFETVRSIWKRERGRWRHLLKGAESR